MKHVVLYHDDLVRQTATITDDVIVYSSAQLKKGVSKNGIDWRRCRGNVVIVF